MSQKRYAKKHGSDDIKYTQTVRYGLMMDTAQKYECSNGDLYCGYGRQPIIQKEPIELGGLEITVTCSFDSGRCTREWHKDDERFYVENCIIYRYFMDTLKTSKTPATKPKHIERAK